MNYFNIFNKLYEELNSINKTDNISSKIIEKFSKDKNFYRIIIHSKKINIKSDNVPFSFKEEYIK